MVKYSEKLMKRETLCPMVLNIYFWQAPYLEREEKITDQSNFVNDLT